jgi:hypothetical protein
MQAQIQVPNSPLYRKTEPGFRVVRISLWERFRSWLDRRRGAQYLIDHLEQRVAQLTDERDEVIALCNELAGLYQEASQRNGRLFTDNMALRERLLRRV